MSDLETLCQTLEAVSGEIASMAQQLRHESLRLVAAAGVAARGGDHAAGAHDAAAALEAAARACQTAAGHLAASHREGHAFVARTVGAVGVAAASGGMAGDSDLTGRDGLTEALGAVAVAGAAVGGAGRPAFSDSEVREAFEMGRDTNAGRAYYEPGDGAALYAASLQPFDGEYTIDMHGSPKRVAVGPRLLDARQLAELIRADPNWKGRPVRLFSCNTGQGENPIAQRLAADLGVDVTAPVERAWSNRRGESWVAGKTGGPPIVPGWRTFTP